MPIYTVVIPVYNAEKYLEQCVDSVLEQAASCEIILVNDGSVDASPEICDRYAQQYPCVKVIHQANQGVSAARNAGIAAAEGAYILFLDGDDYWDDSLLQKLEAHLARNPDLIEFGYQYFDGHTDHKPTLPAVEAVGMTGMAYFEAHKAQGCLPIGSSCTAAFRRQLLQDHGIRFCVGVTYGEDLDFHMHCLKYAEAVASIHEALYYYRRNEASATRTPTVKKMRDMLTACVKMYRLFPCAMFANYYCMKILNLERLPRSDAKQTYDILRENRDILRHVSGGKMRLICMLYRFFGWYGAARLVQAGLRARYTEKG